jgi:integrase
VRHTAPNTFVAKLDAEHWLASERRLIDHGAWSPPAQRAAEQLAAGETLGAFAARWIEQRDLTPRTRVGYESMLARHIIGTPLAGLPLNRVTAEAVRAWHAGLDRTKPTARAHSYAMLHAVLATAVEFDLLANNPAKVARGTQAPTQRQPVILTAAEVAAIADAIQPARFRTLILAAAWCGPRWGELIELRRKDIGPDAATVTIARGATHRQGHCHIGTPKNKWGRTVAVPPHIRPALAAHLASGDVGKGGGALLWPAARGGCHLNDKVFREYYRAAQTAAGRDGETLPHARVHDLRHFAGTTAASVGTLKETMTRLGHRTVRASLIYQGIVADRDAEVADALSKLAFVTNVTEED